MVRISVSATAGRRYLLKNVFILFFLPTSGYSAIPDTLRSSTCLEREVQRDQHQVNQLNKDERDDDPTDAIDQQIAPQQGTCSHWTVFHTARASGISAMIIS